MQTNWSTSTYSVTQDTNDMYNNVNVYIYSPDYPVSSIDCTLYTLILEHTFYSLLSSGENSAIADSAAAVANHYSLAFFIPSATHTDTIKLSHVFS